MVTAIFLFVSILAVLDEALAYTTPSDVVYVSNLTTQSSCPSLKSIPNAKVELRRVSGILSAHVKCNEDYSLLGKEIYFCNGFEWDFESNEPPIKCVQKCYAPPEVEHGQLEFDKLHENIYSLYAKYLSGTIVKYSCLDGYYLEPPLSIKLCENGFWIGKDALCRPLVNRCSALPIEHGFVQFSLIYPLASVGEEVKYSCNDGYRLVGSDIVKCTGSGMWHPSIPRCERDETSGYTDNVPNVACGPVPMLNSKLHPHIRLISISGNTAEVGCDRNYKNALSICRTSTFQCKNGKWEGEYPRCVEVYTCRPPPKIQYAQVSDRDYDKSDDFSYFPIGSQITYQCLKGYIMDGSSTITCLNGCWEPTDGWPACIRTKEDYFVELDDLDAILISSATGAGVLGILLLACLIVACKKRKALARTISIPSSAISSIGHHPAEVVNDHAVLLQHPDRLALIAFADGVQNNQNTLPTYDEATRDRSTLIQVSRLQLHRPHWPSLAICRGSNRSRSSSNNDHVVRHGSFVSHTPSMRSGGESMGSTDTVTISEGSTNITLDTASSHSAVSQNPSCRGHCGSLASFDGCSIVNTEGVPLLEESELEDINGGTNEAENPIISDNTSSKISTHSAPIMSN